MSSLDRVYNVCHSTKYAVKQRNKKQNLDNNVGKKVFESLGSLLLSFWVFYRIVYQKSI